MRKIITVLGVLCLLTALFAIKGTVCTSETQSLVESPVEVETENVVDFILQPIVEETEAPTEPPRNMEPVTLKRNFGFYQGSVPMQKITKIIFTDEIPEDYDESWYANEADTEDLMGYLKGTVVSIVGDEIYTNKSCKWMFAGENNYEEPLWQSLKVIEGLDRLNTSQTLGMQFMFLANEYVTELDLSMWDVSQVLNMTMMFCECLNLETIEFADWDTSSCREFTAMFQGNSHKGDMKLKNIDVSNWDTSKAMDMSHMFYGCAQLESLDLSKWNVEKVGSFSHMFADCYNLRDLDISGWDTINVVTFDAFLNDCRSLKTIDISKLETSSCEQFSQMFEACHSLEEIIGIEDMDVSNAQDYAFSETFHQCYSLKSLDLSKWDTSLADNYARMFTTCKNLEYLNISGFATENVWTVTEMFRGCTKLKEVVGLNELDFSMAQGCENMFENSGLKNKY